MFKQSEIEKVILNAISEIIKPKNNIDFNDVFIGAESNYESIDIIQIISSIEDQLEKDGYEGCDLLEKIFENDKLTFYQLSLVIKDYLNS